MRIFVPEEHAKALTAIVAVVCNKYSGLPREDVTLINFEKELLSEVYKHLYMENDLKYFPALKRDLKQLPKLLDPYRPAEPLEVIAINETDPVDTIVKGTFV